MQPFLSLFCEVVVFVFVVVVVVIVGIRTVNVLHVSNLYMSHL